MTSPSPERGRFYVLDGVDADLPRGALVRVTGQDGALLHVEPAVP